MTTDTPRTDAFYPSDADYWEEEAKRYCSNSQYWRERSEKAEAEVDRLNNILENTRMSRDTMIEDRNLLDQELAASKAEAERLREDNQKLRARLNYVQGCDCDNYLHPYCNKLTK